VLAELPLLTLATWGSATLLTLVCLCHLLVFGQFRVYRFFTLYLFVNVLQSVGGALLYQRYGFASRFAWNVMWASQAFVVIARALAATEICFLTLGKYKGIWRLAAKMIGTIGILVLALALFFGRKQYQFAVLILEIGLEASIATAVAGLLLFARYYGVRILPATQRLALGLGLLSCLKILNDLVVERFATSYVNTWSDVSSGVFIAMLLIWLWALRQPAALRLTEPSLSPSHVYESLIPEVNQRLRDLNEQLDRLWPMESPKW